MYRKYYPNKTETFVYHSNIHLLEAISDFNTIGGRLKYLRKYRNILQEELAKLAGINICTLKRLENNQVIPTLDTCKKIALVLNISVNLLYDDYLSFISSDYSTFFKALRKELNFTQLQLAKKLGVTRKTISFWERNISFPTPKSYILLCKYITKGE